MVWSFWSRLWLSSGPKVGTGNYYNLAPNFATKTIQLWGYPMARSPFFTPSSTSTCRAFGCDPPFAADGTAGPLEYLLPLRPKSNPEMETKWRPNGDLEILESSGGTFTLFSHKWKKWTPLKKKTLCCLCCSIITLHEFLVYRYTIWFSQTWIHFRGFNHQNWGIQAGSNRDYLTRNLSMDITVWCLTQDLGRGNQDG